LLAVVAPLYAGGALRGGGHWSQVFYSSVLNAVSRAPLADREVVHGVAYDVGVQQRPAVSTKMIPSVESEAQPFDFGFP
jgi:hypothetical protein